MRAKDAQEVAGPAGVWWHKYAGVALGGVALGLSFPGYFPAAWGLERVTCGLAWVALAPWFFYVGRVGTLRHDFALSLAMFVPFLATLNYWLLFMHPLTWLGMPFFVSVMVVLVAWVGVSSVIGLGMSMGGLFYGYLARRLITAGFPNWAIPVVAGLFWMAFEWAQTQGDLAYPWGPLALSQTPWPALLQTLPLAGPYLLGGLMAAFSAAVAHAFRHEPRPLKWLVGVVAIAIAYGAFTLAPTVSGTVRVAVVQGNFASDQKWNPQMVEAIAARYLAMSAQASRAAIVVWPESAIPILWNDPSRAEARALVGRIRTAFEASKRHLVSGAFFVRRNQDGQNFDLFNATTVIGPQASPRPIWAQNKSGQARTSLPYIESDGWRWEAKRHLVPFGEFMPFRGILPDVLARLNVLSRDLTRGSGPRPFNLGSYTIGTGVCFDSIFPRALADDTATGATILAVVTNDAWYKNTAAPHQHFAHSILRAVENRRFLLRAANTGVSGIIDPYGRVLAHAGVFKSALVEGQIAPMAEITPYTRFGDWPVALALLILIATLGGSLRMRPIDERSGRG